jgi:curved DNA-binding protein CbpA
MFVDHYKMLGVQLTADFTALKRAYYRRAKECHPDRFGGDRQKEEEFKLLANAFNVLSDPRLRREYDYHYRARYGEVMSSNVPENSRVCTEQDFEAILDTRADDTLEELIVGNVVPRDASLATLLLDLQRTEAFCLFREAKNLYYSRKVEAATNLFETYVKRCPGNILGHYFLARCLRHHHKWRRVMKELRVAVRIGQRRQPPLRLERIRRELEVTRRKHQGFLSRLLKGGDQAELRLNGSPEERMQREMSRTMRQLEQQGYGGKGTGDADKESRKRLR